MNQADEPFDADRPSRRSTVNVPTVLASAGVAAVVSAVVVTIGVVGIAVGGGFDGSGPRAAAQTPTVVNLGAAQSALPQAVAAPAAASVAPSAAAAPVTEQVPASAGGAGTGTAPAVGSTPPVATAAPAPTAVAPAAPTASAPQALSPGQLNTKVRLLMNTGASRSARADELEAGARGLGPVDAVADVLRVSGAGFTYQMIAPVTVSGTSMTATLQMSLVGQGSRTRALTWVWTGDKWKLSDRSTCDVAGLALVPCTL